MQLVTRCQLVSKMVRFLMGTSHLPLHSTVTTPHGWVDLITKREGEIRERGQQRRMTNGNGCSLIWVNQLWLRRSGHRDVRIITNGSQVIRFTLETTEFGLYLIRKEGASRWVCIEERQWSLGFFVWESAIHGMLSKQSEDSFWWGAFRSSVVNWDKISVVAHWECFKLITTIS